MILSIVSFVSKFLALGAIASQIFIVLTIIFLLLPYKREIILKFFSRNGIKIAFIASLIASLGSLFYSTYAGFVPCSLCWFQRVFMYPEAIILGLAILKKDSRIVDYILTLSLVGLAISIYHNYIYIKSLSSNFCTISEPCTVAYVSEFHYISIPMMALTAFLLISLSLIITAFYRSSK
jgi:disulfide bond formation protein DsbB